MTDNEPKGVGGWLLLFCFGQVLFAPPRAFLEIQRLWERIGPHPFPVVRQIAVIIAVIIVAVTVYGMIVGIIIWIGNKRGRMAARQYLVVRIALTVVLFAMAMGWAYHSFGAVAAKRMALSMISPSALEIGTCLIWFCYFTYSRRVRNTYCEGIES
ncbi:MAG: hypothetical protein DMF29_03695 [Verrucomicrobia bacterium]|nr:MAG: hypothetical protein DMF29_03695 [Verrucomicrobiota bacterium]